MKLINPESITPPASNYSQGVLIPTNRKRLIVAGQIGVNPDGSVAEGLHAQMKRAWENLFAVLTEAGMTKRDLIKITVFMTQSGVTAEYRKMRDEMLEGHAPAATYLVIQELATPELLVEIEGEAISST